MNDKLPTEIACLQAGLDAIDKALFPKPEHQAIVLTQAAVAAHDSIIKERARIDLALLVNGWAIRHAMAIPTPALAELLEICGLRRERDDDAAYQDKDDWRGFNLYGQETP